MQESVIQNFHLQYIYFLGRYMDRGGSMRGEELAQQMFGARTAAKKVGNA